jgi:hypothetical protein
MEGRCGGQGGPVGRWVDADRDGWEGAGGRWLSRLLDSRGLYRWTVGWCLSAGAGYRPVYQAENWPHGRRAIGGLTGYWLGTTWSRVEADDLNEVRMTKYEGRI